jgi:hypothetical protein
MRPYPAPFSVALGRCGGLGGGSGGGPPKERLAVDAKQLNLEEELELEANYFRTRSLALEKHLAGLHKQMWTLRDELARRPAGAAHERLDGALWCLGAAIVEVASARGSA